MLYYRTITCMIPCIAGCITGQLPAWYLVLQVVLPDDYMHCTLYCRLYYQTILHDTLYCRLYYRTITSMIPCVAGCITGQLPAWYLVLQVVLPDNYLHCTLYCRLYYRTITCMITCIAGCITGQLPLWYLVLPVVLPNNYLHDTMCCRLYYRTITCMPLKPQEVNQDSEDEATPKWLCQKSLNVGSPLSSHYTC